LFAVIGTTYGQGDGLNTFNLPNLSGKVAVGPASGLVLGSTGGEATHVLQSSEIVAHTHDVPSHTHTSSIVAKTPEFTHTITQPAYNYNTLNGGLNASQLNRNFNAYNGRTSAAMTRSTNLSVAAHNAADCTMSGGITDCPAFDTELAGSSQPHDNMMPYLSLTYLIYSPETIYPPGMVYFNGCMVAGPSGCYFTGKG
jgi:microcystin-dependent protein